MQKNMPQLYQIMVRVIHAPQLCNFYYGMLWEKGF